MADRRNLRDRAKAAGKSVAGTLAEGAQKLRQKATTIARDDESGIEISEVDGQYLVIDSDGSAIGPYDDKMKAAAKARELKRETQTDTGRVQQAATRFSEGVNRRLGVGQANGGATNENPGPSTPQKYATAFSEKVNQTVTGGEQNSTRGRTVKVRYKQELDKWVVEGRTADFGMFETKSPAVSKAKEVYETNDDYTGLQVQTQDGAVQTSRSKGTAEGANPTEGQATDAGQAQQDMGLGGLFGGGTGDGGGPSLPFASGGESDDEDGTQPGLPFMEAGGGGGEPQFPGFGGGDGDGQEPMLPGFDMGDNDGQPAFPGFGMDSGGGGMPGMFGGENGDGPQFPGFQTQDDEQDDERFPWS